MRGLTDEAIKERQQKIFKKFSTEESVLLDTVVNEAPEGSNEACFCLGRSIMMLSEADVAIFAVGWEKARGCVIEHKVCEEYGIPFINDFEDVDE